MFEIFSLVPRYYPPMAQFPFESAAIPEWTRASQGAVTFAGTPAVFRSNVHAFVGLRLVHLTEVEQMADDWVNAKMQNYKRRFDQYSSFLNTMVRVVAEKDVETTAAMWNEIDQVEANEAFTCVLCEREPYPKERGMNLATRAQNYYGLNSSALDTVQIRDRRVVGRDHQLAWEASPSGRCRSCGNPTISQVDHDRLRRMIKTNQDLFNVKPEYQNTLDVMKPLWASRILIGAKGVADHIVPWSKGGTTTPENLANVCAGCNYSRNDASLNLLRVAAYA